MERAKSMGDEADRIVDDAIAWHLRLPDAGAAEWHAFTLWLEESPDHARAYDRVAADDALLTDMLHPAEWQPAPDVPAGREQAGRRGWRTALAGTGTAIAAGLAFLLLPDGPSFADEPLVLQTAPGVRRVATLADGTRIAINGDTRLTIDRGTMRRVTLEQGEAIFTVHHDARHPFEVHSGGVRLLDAGTAFNVVREGSRLSVQVAEGMVVFRPDREGLKLTPGAALSFTDGDARPHVARIAAGDVGSWRHGRLAFSAAPLPSVATALSRNLGADIRIDPALADLSFTGSLSLAGGTPRAVPQLARLLDTGWTRAGRRWTLTPRDHDPR
jgi:transmembrane sensor